MWTRCHLLQEDSRPVRTRLNPRLRPCHRHRQIGVCDSRATKCSLPKPSSRRCRSPCVGDKALARAPQVRAGEKLNNGSDPLPRSGQAHARPGKDAGFSAETLLGLPEMNWQRVSAHPRIGDSRSLLLLTPQFSLATVSETGKRGKLLGWKALATGGWTRQTRAEQPPGAILPILQRPQAPTADFPWTGARVGGATVVTRQRRGLLGYSGDNFATVEGAKKAGENPDR